MVTRSQSCVKFVLWLMAMLMAASKAQAQISIAPKRYRRQLDYSESSEIGSAQRQYTNGQQQKQKHPEKNARKLEDDVGSELDMSMPSGPSVRMMSIPIQELRLDLSMPTSEHNPAPADVENVSLGDDSDSAKSTPLLASFLAGISALVVASVLFVKMKRDKPGRKGEVDAIQIQQEIEDLERQGDTYSPKGAFAADMQGRMVSFSDWDDDNLVQGEMRDVEII